MTERKEYKNVISKEHFNLNDLIPQLKRKEEKAFKEVFFFLQPGIFYFLFRLTSNKEIAEDLTQETFLRFWTALDGLDANQSCKAYIYKIARNLAINYHDRKINVSSLDDEDSLIILSRNLENEVDQIFLLDDFQNAINTLPERCKTTFLLSRFSGFDYSEIAEIMNVSLQTVKNQMNKALAVLRKRLSHHLE